MVLFWLVLLPIIIALIGYLSKTKKVFVLIGVAQFGLFILSMITLFHVLNNDTITVSLGGYPDKIGINLVADSISALFVMLTCFLFSAMLLFNYHKPYMNKLFLFLFLILQGLINGIFLSTDLFNLYALIEVSTVVVSILIMFKKDSRSIYDGMVYLLTNLVSMTFFLFGVGYIYKIFGTVDLTIIKAHIPYVKNVDSLILPYALLITAIGLKSAIMPLFSWLPRAHGTPSAPSIVSAILSGLYVKAGLYLFIRFQDTFYQGLDTSQLFLVLGFLTAVIGFMFALSQTDIKLILAYSTVSQIGLIIFGLSIGSTYSYYGAIYHIVNHAVFKSTLFLTAGIIIEEYETRDIRKIRGVFKHMPFVAIITIISILGITGAPLFNSSFSKYLIQKGTLLNNYLEYGLIIINIGTIMSFIRYSTMFFGPSNQHYKLRFNQKIAISILALICFFGGVFGSFFVNLLFNVNVTLDADYYVNKAIIYALSLLVSYLFYKYIYSHIKFFQSIRAFELSFNQIIFSIVLFFSFLLTYLMVVFR